MRQLTDILLGHRRCGVAGQLEQRAWFARTAARDGDDGVFELLIVTEDDVRHTVAPSAAAMSGLLAMVGASPVLL